MIYKKLNFKKFSDGRGDLVPLEIGKDFPKADIPFDVERCYFISVPTNDDNALRGRHAHKDLEQVIICINGSFTLDLDDGKGNKESINLSHNAEGIYIKNLIWRELRNFSKECTILVLASKHYNEHDYVKDYREFLGMVKRSGEING